MIKKSWRKANRRHDILEELIVGGDTQVYNTLFRWIKSGKIDRKDFVGIMRHIEMHGLNLYDPLPPEQPEQLEDNEVFGCCCPTCHNEICTCDKDGQGTKE